MPPIKYIYIAVLRNGDELTFDAPYIEKAREMAEAKAKKRGTSVINVRRG